MTERIPQPVPAGVNLRGLTHGSLITYQQFEEMRAWPEFRDGIPAGWVICHPPRALPGYLLLWEDALPVKPIDSR